MPEEGYRIPAAPRHVVVEDPFPSAWYWNASSPSVHRCSPTCPAWGFGRKHYGSLGSWVHKETGRTIPGALIATGFYGNPAEDHRCPGWLRMSVSERLEHIDWGIGRHVVDMARAIRRRGGV